MAARRAAKAVAVVLLLLAAAAASSAARHAPKPDPAAEPPGSEPLDLESPESSHHRRNSQRHHHHKPAEGEEGGGRHKHERWGDQQTCLDEKLNKQTPQSTLDFLNANYNEMATADYKSTCAASANAPCAAAGGGCSLWALAGDRCRDPHNADTVKYGFVFSGSSKKGSGEHPIGVPCKPVRGLEDVPIDEHSAVELTKAMWPQMWVDMVNNAIGADSSGYPEDRAGLVINTPSSREYHQLHIHSGARTPQFDACVAKMSRSNAWQLATCDGLQEGGSAGAEKLAGQLLYRTASSLDHVWDHYSDAVSMPPGKGGLALGGTDTSKYHVGVLVSSPRTLVGKGAFLIALYAPPTIKSPKLGRGSFMLGN